MEREITKEKWEDVEMLEQNKRVNIGGKTLIEITDFVSESGVGYGASLSSGSSAVVYVPYKNGSRNKSQSGHKITCQPNKKH